MTSSLSRSPIAAAAAAASQSPQDTPGEGSGRSDTTSRLYVILADAVKRGASDVIMKVGRPPALKISGRLVFTEGLACDPGFMEALAVDLLALLPTASGLRHSSSWSTSGGADFAIGVPGVGRFRINMYRQRGTPALVIRVVPAEVGTLAELRLPSVLAQIAKQTRGLVLVTGVTGSGKSTALAAMLRIINEERQVNMITLEDPVEHTYRDKQSSISQREVGLDTPSFSEALRHVLRQAPDVIVIGEIRDHTTMEAALEAADTGHLVFSTLHTADAAQTINRVVSFYPPEQHADIRLLFAANLSAIVSLRLVPHASGEGRIPVCEVLRNTPAIRERIALGGDGVRELMQQPNTYGMVTFDQALMDAYHGSLISQEEATRFATSPDDFRLRASGVAAGDDSIIRE
jgi:twitching motility protein PilT